MKDKEYIYKPIKLLALAKKLQKKKQEKIDMTIFKKMKEKILS